MCLDCGHKKVAMGTPNHVAGVNHFTGSTKVAANYPISNIVPHGVQKHSYLLLNRHMYRVIQQIPVSKDFTESKKWFFP
jgi:hypothetical protein